MVNKKDRREVCCLYGNENCMEMKRLRVGGLLLSSHVLMAPLAGYTCYPFRMLAYWGRDCALPRWPAPTH